MNCFRDSLLFRRSTNTYALVTMPMLYPNH